MANPVMLPRKWHICDQYNLSSTRRSFFWWQSLNICLLFFATFKISLHGWLLEKWGWVGFMQEGNGPECLVVLKGRIKLNCVDNCRVFTECGCLFLLLWLRTPILWKIKNMEDGRVPQILNHDSDWPISMGFPHPLTPLTCLALGRMNCNYSPFRSFIITLAWPCLMRPFYCQSYYTQNVQLQAAISSLWW